MGYTVFLDRDGVINMDSPGYIKSEPEFEFIPKSPEAISLLSQNGFTVIVITNQSCMVGDSAKDIECARNAGCAKAVLVKTGNGEAAQVVLLQKGIQPDHVSSDLYDAALWIIKHVKR